MQCRPQAALGVAALTSMLSLATSAHAYLSSFTVTPSSKCLAGKIKSEGKGAVAYAGCHAKGAAKALPTDPACLGKASTKLTSAFTKLDAKPPCLTTGDGPSRDTDTFDYAVSLDAAVGHGAAGAQKCDAAKTKVVGKYMAAIMGCYAKAAAKAPGTVGNGPGSCTGKALDKLNAALAKAELKPPCTTTGNAAALVSATDCYLNGQVCLLDPGNAGCSGPCGNGCNDPGEPCDASAPVTGWAQCGPSFTCTACNCACPTTVVFSSDATAPQSILDTGWTGISHRTPILSNGDITVGLACGAANRPCGTCTISGPVANPNAGAGQLDNQRCTNDTTITCTTDAPCIAGGGTCQFFFGSNLPLAAGGVSTCVVNQVTGPVSGTASVESGEAATIVNLTARVYAGIAIDNPCPRCIGDASINDGVAGGVCSGGPNDTLPCDSNGMVPGRPDFGSTSLDCPPLPGALLSVLPVDLSNATDPVVKALGASSPTCTGLGGERCLCDTCNNIDAEPCDADSDCPDPAGPIGAICGGRRCLGGTNNGAACTANSACPGGGICNRPGEPTKPDSCIDDSSSPFAPCQDTAPVDGVGECTSGPPTGTCSVASGHGQRGCIVDAECGGGMGSCEVANRRCFLTGGFSGHIGTNTLIAEGMEDTPVADTAHPTLGAVFCVGPTTAAAVNAVTGLPGPSRVTIKGTAIGLP